MIKIPLVDLKANYISIKDEIDSAILDVISKSSFIMGPHVKAFDENFAKYIGTKYCSGVASGTVALHLALHSLGIKNPDEVITVPNTFMATVEAITMCGAKPVFVDINPDNFNINPKLIEAVISEKTKAIVCVHLYGHPCDMEPIMKICKEHNLFLIEDAAQAHGAEYKHRKMGTFGDLACFSMYPAKVLGAYGDAGAIITNDDNLGLLIEKLRDHGRISKYEHIVEGFNYRMDALQAAILNVKLKHIDKWIDSRSKNAQVYNQLLEGIVKIPKEASYAKHCYYMYVIRCENRDDLKKFLEKNGIQTGIHYPIPLHLQPALKHLGFKKGDFPETESAAEEILSIPMYPELTNQQINYIVEKIKEFYG